VKGLRVAVVGGGIGGLCLAQGLHRAGASVVVYERDAALASRRQGYRLHVDARAGLALQRCLSPELFQLFLAPGPARAARAGRHRRDVPGADPDIGTSAAWPPSRVTLLGDAIHAMSPARVGEQLHLGVSPPQDRPCVSRPAGLGGFVPAGGGFLSFGAAPVRAGALSAATASRPGSMSPGGACLARPRAGARGTTVASAATAHAFPSASSHSARASPGSSPTSRSLTSGDAGCTRSSSSRTPRAGHATGTLPWSGTRSR